MTIEDTCDLGYWVYCKKHIEKKTLEESINKISTAYFERLKNEPVKKSL